MYYLPPSTKISCSNPLTNVSLQPKGFWLLTDLHSILQTQESLQQVITNPTRTFNLKVQVPIMDLHIWHPLKACLHQAVQLKFYWLYATAIYLQRSAIDRVSRLSYWLLQQTPQTKVALTQSLTRICLPNNAQIEFRIMRT